MERSPSVRVYTLGTFRVLVDERVVEESAWRRRAARQILKVLVSKPGRRLTRDEIVEIFWPDSEPDAAASNLRSTLHALRRVLQPRPRTPSLPIVFADRDGIWLRQDVELWTDADDFERAVADAFRSADPLPRLEAASMLYAGEYLPDDANEDWAAERREVLKHTWTDLQFGLAAAADKRGQVDAAVRPLERLLRADASDERAARELMKLLARNGRRTEALRVYQRLVESLRTELGIEPAHESVELHVQISSSATSGSAFDAESFRCTYPFPTPGELINRQPELATLLRLVAESRTAGRVALVTAPAGIGKSALVGEVVRRSQAERVLCLAGGCYEERAALPFGPFHDALVDFLLAQPADSLRARLGSSVEDLGQVIPELRYQLQLSSPMSAPVDRMRAFSAIHACLRALVEEGPVLVCLEDLHAADDATLQLLHYLARQTQRLPLMFIGTVRSDEVATEEPLAQSIEALIRERLARRIVLSPLTQAETDRLVSARLDGLPSSALSDSLYTTTGGNPLFVEQLLLALGEGGQLERKAGVWHGDTTVEGTPPIVREVIAQRLQRLDPVCREVLAMAAVLGQAFEHRTLLAAVEPLHETILLRELDRAITAQILADTPGGYAFRHALLRNAVYWGLSSPRRMLLHARAGELLEQFYSARADDFSAELAHHFVLGGEAAPIRMKALHYSLEAGRRAGALSSNREALQHFSNVLRVIDAAPMDARMLARVEALEGRGYAERGLGLLPAAVATLREVLRLTSDPIRQARVHGEIASALLHGDPEGALEEVKAGVAELAGTEPDASVAATRLRLQSFEAMCCFLAGRYQEVVAIGEEMLPVARSLGDVRALCRPEAVLSWAHIGAGQVSQALHHSQRLLAFAEESQDKSEVAMAEVNLGLEYHLAGAFGDAQLHLNRARALYQESANDVWLSNASQLSARVLLGRGDRRGARDQAEAALALVHEQQDRWVAESQDILGNLDLLAAEHSAAMSRFREALAIRRRIGHVSGIIDSLIGLGRVYERIGEWQGAERQYLEALEVGGGVETSPSVVAAWRHLGRLRCRTGEFSKAGPLLEHALQLARGISETIEYAPTLLAMSELEEGLGHLESAIEYVDQALQLGGTVEFRIEANAAAARLLRGFARRRDDALAAARSALELAEQFGAPFLEGIAHLAAARVYAARQQVTDAAQHYAEVLRSLVDSGPIEYSDVEREIAAFNRSLRANPDPGSQ
ncbi:MAG: tetratricopeptide repeat protein [Chloroflexi bacterium]|nr:tetratricopeptide repeat protein [Chloroflexota bacterium]